MEVAEGKLGAILTAFQGYFQNKWMVRYDPYLWNIHEATVVPPGYTAENILIGRTNNPLERFNKSLNQFFNVYTGGKPNMTQLFAEFPSNISS